MTKEIGIFAAGCFWGVEESFLSTQGVTETEVGYIGGTTSNPSYEDVCRGDTNHAEAVRVFFDSEIIMYEELLDVFFKIHNPTTLNRQGYDFGTQYRSAIFYQNDSQKKISEDKIKVLNNKTFQNKITTKIEEATTFWIAEEYHQKYIRKKQDRNYFGI
ncbi:MAG: peptide-methionine (S)-S-oxide reductase MsrA [Pseudomonadota bacterium]|nr:peptide-methionine (S)-S-oxide reductase MsrA [Pseudomonadota bacterium]MED5274474.1 peptide-methionine (S)-S-oxide reductase MsrA [Pseudomonadota bacterium]